MEKLNISTKQSAAAHAPKKADRPAAKKDFGSLLQKKAPASSKGGAKATAQQASHPNADSTAGAPMGTAGQQAQLGKNPQLSSRPLVQNPHLAKLQQASKQFDAQLAQAKKASAETQSVLGQARGEAKAADLGRNEARAGDVARAETHQQIDSQVRSENLSNHKARAEAQQMAQRNLNGARSANKAALMHGVGAVSVASKNAAVSGVKKARKAKEIPQELLDKLVEEVRVGVNEAGHAEFQIELKEGVLQGMSLRVSANNGKVNCLFVGGDSNAKNFIEASQGSLERALESKGLSLNSLQVA